MNLKVDHFWIFKFCGNDILSVCNILYKSNVVVQIRQSKMNIVGILSNVITICEAAL